MSNVFKMRYILLPTDFSTSAWNTARCALAMFQKPGVRFYLIYLENANRNYTAVNQQSDNREIDLRLLKRKLEKFIAAYQEVVILHPSHKFIDNIRKAVRENRIDLMVFSAAYANNTQDKAQVNNVKEIVTRIKCPVLIIPKDFKFKKLKQFVLLSDFNFKHQSHATKTIAKFIGLTEAHLNILQLSTESVPLSSSQTANKTFLLDALETASHSFHFATGTSMGEALQLFINNKPADMVILFAKHINLSENILFAPVLDKHIDYHKNIPFLIIHE